VLVTDPSSDQQRQADAAFCKTIFIGMMVVAVSLIGIMTYGIIAYGN
jgi:hypothetical protein